MYSGHFYLVIVKCEQQLAELASVGVATVIRAEQGKSVNFQTAQRLAQAFHIEVSLLVKEPREFDDIVETVQHAHAMLETEHVQGKLVMLVSLGAVPTCITLDPAAQRRHGSVSG